MKHAVYGVSWINIAVKNLSWIFLFPLAVALIVFAVSNREVVQLDLWPFPVTLHIPLFIMLFATLVIGVIWGGVATWFSGGSARRVGRIKAREARQAEAEIKRLKEQISKLEADARAGEDRMAALHNSGALVVQKASQALPPSANAI